MINGEITQRFSTPIRAKEARLGGPVFALGWIMESAARTGMVGEVVGGSGYAVGRRFRRLKPARNL